MNGMNNGYNNFQQNQYNNPNPMAQADQAVLEKKNKLKKTLFTFAKFIIIFLILFFGKNYIDKATFKYKDVVDSSLMDYYINPDSSNLKPILDALSKYKKNYKMVKNIQKYANEKVGEWFSYIDEKYDCDKENYNSCVVQLREFQFLVQKLDFLYENRGGGYSIIEPDVYNYLKAEASKKIESLNKVKADKGNYRNPYNSEYLYTMKCQEGKNCDCRNNDICTCDYIYKNKNGKTLQQSIKCYKPGSGSSK